VEKEKKRLANLLEAIALLKCHGLQGSGLVRAYHTWRVAPLMARTLPLYGMVPIMKLGGTVVAQGAFCDSEIEQCIREALVTSKVIFPVAGHSEMRPITGFIDVVNVFYHSSPFMIPLGFVTDFRDRELHRHFGGFRSSHAPLLKDDAVRAANRARDEAWKKKKDRRRRRRRRRHGPSCSVANTSRDRRRWRRRMTTMMRAVSH
jgi:hypothetical protein